MTSTAPAPNDPAQNEPPPTERAEDTQRPQHLSDEAYARKKAVLDRAREDQAVTGAPTTGVPGDAAHQPVEQVAPLPRH